MVGASGGQESPRTPLILLGGADDWPEWLDPVSDERWQHIVEGHGPNSTSADPHFRPDTDIAIAIFDTITRGYPEYDEVDGKVRWLTVNNQSVLVVMRPSLDGFFVVTAYPGEYKLRGMTDKELALAILDELGDELPSVKLIASFRRSGEWAQVGIQALCDAARESRAVSSGLIREAVDGWSNDMGPVLADKFSAMIAVAA